jgi:hypothetical protein
LKRGENTRLMDSNLIWLTTLTVLILIIAYSLKRLALQVKALVGFSFYLTEKKQIWFGEPGYLKEIFTCPISQVRFAVFAYVVALKCEGM